MYLRWLPRGCTCVQLAAVRLLSFSVDWPVGKEAHGGSAPVRCARPLLSPALWNLQDQLENLDPCRRPLQKYEDRTKTVRFPAVTTACAAENAAGPLLVTHCHGTRRLRRLLLWSVTFRWPWTGCVTDCPRGLTGLPWTTSVLSWHQSVSF